MEIKWIGHSCFLIKNLLGKKILIDPMQIYPYIQKYDLKPDIITFSHSHNNEFINDCIINDFKVINNAGYFENEYFIIKGFESYRDNFSGLRRGENIIYLFEIDGIKLCHLGSLGHLLNEKLINKLSNLDFLLIPIGGHFCLDGHLAAKLATVLKPKYIIPMSFKTSSEYFYLDGPLKFLSSLKDIIYYDTDTIYTNNLPLNDNSTIILLRENNKEPLN